LSKVKFSVKNISTDAANYRFVLTSAKLTNVYEDGVYDVNADSWTPGSTMREYVLDNTTITNGATQYHNHEVINSEIHSVFDYLYKNCAEARESAMRKYGRVSDVDSENLMYAVIRDVLSKSDYSKYDVVMHVPLRMILSDLTKLNTRELSFTTNHLTHVDFLIFSRLTHQPILVVEVDGFAYHNDPKQQERDQVKNSVLEKYNIPILRLSTVGSGEKQKLISVLEKIS
jgi:hypothetical protein